MLSQLELLILLRNPKDQSGVNNFLMDLAAIHMKLMHSAAKDKVQNIVRQRVSVANKKAAAAGRPPGPYRECLSGVYGVVVPERLLSRCLVDFPLCGQTCRQ